MGECKNTTKFEYICGNIYMMEESQSKLQTVPKPLAGESLFQEKFSLNRFFGILGKCPQKKTAHPTVNVTPSDMSDAISD